MLKLDYIPTWLTFFLCLGILLGYHFPFKYEYLLMVILLLIVLLFLSFFKANNILHTTLRFSIISFVIFIFIGIITITIHDETSHEKHYSKFLEEENHTILQIDKILKKNSFYINYWANIIQINNQDVRGKVLIKVVKDSFTREFDVDDIIFTKCDIAPLKSPLDPYEFNYKEYLQRQQIYHQLKLNDNEILLLDLERHTIKGFASKLRNTININLQKFNFSNDQLSIINALLLGQRQDISTELYNNYKNAGAVHILAISGLHIGIILLILNFLLKPIELFKYGKFIKLLILVIILWLFALIAGYSASVVRAVTMFTAITIGLTFNKRSKGNNALVISMFFLLLFNPFYLFDVGFQLSYLAVFFIINLQPELVKLFKPKYKIIRYFWLLFTVTIAAQIGVLPLSLYYFHQFPGLFFISSMVIIPFLGLILGLGFLIIILVLFQTLPITFVKFYAFIIETLNNFVAYISDQESFLFQNIPISIFLTITIYIFLFSGLLFLNIKTQKSVVVLFLSIIIIQVVLIYEKQDMQTSGEFIIFNKKRSTIITIRKGDELTIFTGISQENLRGNNAIKNYKINVGKFKKEETRTLNNIYSFNNNKVLIIDSTAIYPNYFKNPEFLLLRQSPKINLERMIKEIQPRTIIVDASNYKSYIQRWEKTCKNHQIDFYNTSKEGAFIYAY